ncbi:hypothetical protein [Deefgea sp. CFH1-16]|uniref:hypothetical protein n=1 Tax=Deefgea sp. CFH1-16 TaxID=2675457 RepID=UPI0019402B86|nr:hypothetical protein [Deefgea sp. CFH1-16]MBM5573655.1 hypothetical protein [Deefgea sp. CFH1-16]
MMFKLQKLIIVFFVLLFSKNILAGMALPVSPMQRVFSAGVQIKAVKRGFAVNDPRFGATLNSMSLGAASVAGTTAAAVVAGAITAPAWATVAIAAGVGAVVTVGVTLAINGVVDWLFSPDQKDATPITQKKKIQPSGSPSTTGGLIAGGAYWKTNNYMASDAMSTIQSAFADTYNSTYANFTTYSFYLDGCAADSSTTFNCIVKRVSKADGTATNYSNFRASYFASGAPRNCPQGQVSNATSCVAPQTVPDNAPDNLKLSAQQAINNLSPVELAKPLSPEIVAPLADKLWRDAAAQPGYAGLPYLANDPITAQELDVWRQQNPQNWPTVQDFVAPQPATNQPWTLPIAPTSTTQDPSQNPSPNTNPAANNPLQNLGPDPNIGTPNLEATPTAQQILQPLFNLFPDFRSFVMPSHQSVCPKPSFNAFGSTYILESHCNIAEEQRSFCFP